MLTGALRSSATIKVNSGARVSSMKLSYTIGYAKNQEFGDQMGYRNYTTPGTGPRFLSTSFEANQYEAVSILSRNIIGSLSF